MSDLNAYARLFRTLGQPARLLLLRLVWDTPLSGERLSELSGLAPATVSHHLAALAEAGLLVSEQQGHSRLHRANRTELSSPLAELITGRARLPEPADPYRAKVLRSFMPSGTLSRIPSQRKKRNVILDELAAQFEPGRPYPEREVNTLLGQFHPDFFTLRRELVDGGWLSRENGIYTRPAGTRD